MQALKKFKEGSLQKKAAEKAAVEKTDTELVDEMSRKRKADPLYAEGMRAFRNHESATIVPHQEAGEWVLGFLDAMAIEVRNRS